MKLTLQWCAGHNNVERERGKEKKQNKGMGWWGVGGTRANIESEEEEKAWLNIRL